MQHRMQRNAEIIRWFVDNAQELFRDLAVGAMTILDNFGNNLGEWAVQIFSWIQDGFVDGIEGLSKR